MYEHTLFNSVSLWHHGIKGMHWGIRRTPEELGHEPKTQVEKSLDNSRPKTIMVQGKSAYVSEKGFAIQRDKLTGYCLKPEGKHSKDFFRIGYKPTDELKLFHDIEDGYDLSKKFEEIKNEDGVITYSVPISLGITEKRTHRTVWMTDSEDGSPRFVTAYVDRKLKKGE